MAYKSKSFNISLLSEENVKKYILPEYNLEDSTISQIKFKNTDKQRAVYKVSHNDKNYCLKKVYFKEDELLFVYSSMEWLYRHNINVPRILPNKNNGRFVNLNNMLFILTPWILGEKCDYDKKEHIFYSIENLSKMHNCAEKFIPIKGGYRKEKKDNIYLSYEKHLNQMLKCYNYAFKYQDKFSNTFINNFDLNLLLAKTSVKIASTINPDNLSRCLCHLDYVNKNIIIDDTSNIWVIDFDKCAKDFRVHDISYFLRRILRRSSTSWNANLTIELLDTYNKLNPLNFDEYKYILSYLSFPQKFWKISRDYYKNITKCNKKSFQKILNKSIQDTEKQIKFSYILGKYIEDKFKKPEY
ncbi:CotS family spore coat protein [Clostridium niameyense]|uniref:CotS family spore coat protein n=1 Tax=Clostridium niameyense TaxID=1622073 RepID=A0A6M0R7Q0_9CLOT|nr:CotS family spore coat protein [Clostridium niameyense]NEZ45720.1 CotS family spore coat protein [Clostridium niameyense]